MFMIYTGMWPLETSNTLVQKIYDVYALTLHIVYTLLVLSLYLVIPYVLKHVPEKIMEQFIIIILYSTTVGKLYIIVTGEVRELIREIRDKDDEGVVKEKYPQEVSFQPP